MDFDLFGLDDNTAPGANRLTDGLYDAVITEIFQPEPKEGAKPSIIVCFVLFRDNVYHSWATYVPFTPNPPFRSLLEAILNRRLKKAHFKDFNPKSVLNLIGKSLSLRLETSENGYLRVFKYSHKILPEVSKMMAEYRRPGWVEQAFGHADLTEADASDNLNNLLADPSKKAEEQTPNNDSAAPIKEEEQTQTQTESSVADPFNDLLNSITDTNNLSEGTTL